MCFAVNPAAPRRKARVAWKVVEMTKARYVRSSAHPDFYWQPGEIEPQGDGPYIKIKYYPWGNSQIAHKGIYVFTLLSEAQRIQRSYGTNYVILKVFTHPDDWLGTAYPGYGPMALYKKVRVPVNQPYLEWL